MYVRGSLLVMALVAVSATPALASRGQLPAELKEQVKAAQTVYVQAIALTEKGTVSPKAIRTIVERRLHALGYTTVSSPEQPHDVVVKVKCEERKTWEGTTRLGGDADLPGAPSRLWKGPACQITYRVDGTSVEWRREIRSEFVDAIKAAKKAGQQDPGQYALRDLQSRLETDEFPLLLTGEWGQYERLLTALQAPGTSHQAKRTILSFVDSRFPERIVPVLEQFLTDTKLAPEAARALGRLGDRGTTRLLDLLATADDPAVRAAAAAGLGMIGQNGKDARIIPALLAVLDEPEVGWGVLNEVARALGRMPDDRSYQPLTDLSRKVWTIRSTDPELEDLRETIFWSLRQIRSGDHSGRLDY